MDMCQSKQIYLCLSSGDTRELEVKTNHATSGNPNPFEGEPETYTQLSTMMSRMWVSFVVNGDPNFSGGEFHNI